MSSPEGRPPTGGCEAARLFEEMMAITARLRGPGGCAWDREQDLASVVAFLAAEAEELRQAFLSGDFENLKEELGDLLFNAILLADLAGDQGRFTLADALRGIRDKLVRRHPHVFAEPRDLSAEEALRQWDRIKAGEKRAKGPDGGAGAPA